MNPKPTSCKHLQKEVLVDHVKCLRKVYLEYISKESMLLKTEDQLLRLGDVIQDTTSLDESKLSYINQRTNDFA